MRSQPGSIIFKISIYTAFASLILAANVPALAQVAEDANQDGTIDEITVYSTRRGISSLQDTPTSIGLLTLEDMERIGTVSFDDISRFIVGLDVVNEGPGNNKVVIRGINAEGESSAAIVWDEMPTSGSGESASEIGQRMFDLDVYDVQQVEVLRGPQGTLYGANSLTGVVHFVTNKPQMDDVSAEIVGSFANVEHSDDIGYQQRGFINFPIIEDKVAMRIAGWHRFEPGFIDAVSQTPTMPSWTIFAGVPQIPEVGINATDINEFRRSGFRASLAANMGDKSDLLFQYIYQTTESHGGPNDRPLFSPVAYIGFAPSGDYQTFKTANDTADEKLTMMGLTLKHRFGDTGELTFASSFATKKTDITTDFSGLLYLGVSVIGNASGGTGLPRALGNIGGCLAPDDPVAVANFLNYPDICYPGAGDGALGMAHVQDTDLDLFTTELRFVSSLDGPFNYVVGGQAQKRTIDFYGAFEETDPNTGIIYEVTEENTRMFEREADFLMTSWAIYGEVSWDIVENLTLTVGGRTFGTHKDEAGITYSNMYVQPGVLNPDPADPSQVLDTQFPIADETRSEYDETASIFKGELSWRMGDNSMTYANISQGYRSGGAINQVVPGMPDSFDHDETMNYEIGAKTAWFDNRLIVNAALYKIDFIDMQYRAPFQNDAFDAQLNCDGTCAESLGYELEISFAATDNLSFYVNYGHTENEILSNLYRPYEDETLGYASLDGDPLSVQTPVDTASAGVQFLWQAANVDWFARLDYSYTGGLKRVNNDRQCCEPFVQGQPITDASDPRFEGHGIPGIPDNEYSGDIPLATLEQDIPTASWQALHARIGFQGETWGVDLFARNITDELGAIHQANNGVFLADRTLAQPRTIGVQFRWSYQ